MGTKLGGLDGPKLGLQSSADLFDKLNFDSARLRKDWHVYDAFNYFITAWHLYHDWGKKDESSRLSKSKRDFNKLPVEIKLVLDVLRDIANGSKHFKLDAKSAKKRRISETHTGKEVGWYQYFFHEDLPAVTAEVHFYFSIRVLRNIISSYFEWVFDDTIPLDCSPIKLLEAIRYCNISTRHGPTPEIWLIDIQYARKRHGS